VRGVLGNRHFYRDPILGAVSDRLGRRKPFLIGGVITASLGWSVIIFGAGMNLAFLLIALMLTGFSSGSMIICFAYAKESVPAKYAGSVAGLVNTGLMAGPMLLWLAIALVLLFATRETRGTPLTRSSALERCLADSLS